MNPIGPYCEQQPLVCGAIALYRLWFTTLRSLRRTFSGQAGTIEHIEHIKHLHAAVPLLEHNRKAKTPVHISDGLGGYRLG